MSRPRKEVDTSTYAGRFAIRLKTLREKAGWTVDELAIKTGISIATLYSWENATRSPTIGEDLLILAKSLGCNVRNLLPKE